MTKALIISAQELALLDVVSHMALALYTRATWLAQQGAAIDSDNLRLHLLDEGARSISNTALRSAMRELIAVGLVVLDRPRELHSARFPLRTKR